MNINQFVSILLIICGAVCLTSAFFYMTVQKNAGRNKISVVGMGISTAVWCLSSGFFGLVSTDTAQRILFILQLLGIIAFLISSVCLFCVISDIPQGKSLVIQLVALVLGILDFVIYGICGRVSFTESRGVTRIASAGSFGMIFHAVLVLILFLSLIFISIYVGQGLSLRRQKRVVVSCFLAYIAVMLFCIPEVLLPLFGVDVQYFSGLGVTITYLIIWGRVSSYNRSTIAIANLAAEIFNNPHIGVVMLDLKGKIRDTNDYAKNLLGINYRPALFAKDLFDVSEEEIAAMYKEAMSEKALQKRWKTSCDKTVCSVNPQIIKDRNAEPVCLMLYLFNLTYEEELLDEIRAENQAKNIFLATMSHEIRTPINAVMGMNEMILRGNISNDIRDYAKDIEGASKILLSVVNDILDYAKIESGNFNIVTGPYNLKDTLEECYNMINIMAKDKGIEFTFSCAPNLPRELEGDVVRIKQILVNILTNAVKNTGKGRVSLEVTGTTAEDNMLSLEVVVTDNGIGVKDDVLENAFTSFKDAGRQGRKYLESTGLGYSITRQLVDLMDGSLLVNSVYGKGTTYVVKLPQKIHNIERIGVLEPSQEMEEHPSARRMVCAPKAEILVVDDVPANLKVFRYLLKKCLVKIETAAGGEESLELIRKKKYDLIFMDHMMPGMDGVEVLKVAKTLENNPNAETPIIMLTANAVIGAREEYLNDGFTDYLSKPIVPWKLEDMLIKYLPEDKVE